jgi:hypothetical protein
MVQHGDELSYEIGSALRLQPSHTTQRGGLLRLAAATPKISAEITQKKQMNRPANTHAPLLTTRDRSLDTAVRPRKNAIAGALCYRTCADAETNRQSHQATAVESNRTEPPTKKN